MSRASIDPDNFCPICGKPWMKENTGGHVCSKRSVSTMNAMDEASEFATLGGVGKPRAEVPLTIYEAFHDRYFMFSREEDWDYIFPAEHWPWAR
jgi:hypothetical protein